MSLFTRVTSPNRAIIRLGRDEDVPEIRKMLARILPQDFADTEEFRRFWIQRCDDEWAENKEVYIRHLLSGEAEDGRKSVVHVAIVDGTLRAFGFTIGSEIAGNFVEGPNEGPDKGPAPWRRRRLGSAVMMQSLSFMRAQREMTAWLGVSENAKGPQQFYEGCLFVKTSDKPMVLPPGHNGRPPADSEFAVKDIRMELSDVVSAHERLQSRLAIGEAAFWETIEVELKPLKVLRVTVGRIVGGCKRKVLLSCRSLCDHFCRVSNLLGVEVQH